MATRVHHTQGLSEKHRCLITRHLQDLRWIAVIEVAPDIVGRKPLEHEMYCTDLDHGFRQSRRPLVILAVAA